MSELYLMITVIERKHLPKFVTLYQEHSILTSIVALGRGTAPEGVAAFLLSSAEKAVCYSVVTGETWLETKRLLRRSLHIETPGMGIVFTVPMSSIGGRRELAFFTEEQHFERNGKESEMRGTERELLVVISEPGYNETVMDAARGAGARGGTVLHARGTGLARAERFLGISLSSEREMTFIVVPTKLRDKIMTAIMIKAGVETPAKSIVFSLPVADAAGMRLADEEDAEEDPPAREKEA